MADFPSNLIDGELFLPSDILSDENSAKIRPPTRFPSELTYVEALAERCSPTARLGHQTKNNNPPCSNTQGKPFLQFGTFNPNQIGMGFQIQFGTFDPNGIGSVANGGVCRGNGIVHNVHHASERVDYHNDLTSGYQLQHTEPVYSQNESFGHEARGKVLHNEQNKGRNHFSPFQTTGGGFQKGTGVFFPRVAGTTMEASKENGAYGNGTHFSSFTICPLLLS
ncbi:hypothetical protein IFM89_036489 [Coptis chinensis]|uniref:Uncharacterized protein n=1 Tax=Coptis chinensis TaxID=261450 RepID=A0A835LY48_9MAGN|nr:hypothetical protein IFM89_036489 [Coptis chinensis]